MAVFLKLKNANKIFYILQTGLEYANFNRKVYLVSYEYLHSDVAQSCASLLCEVVETRKCHRTAKLRQNLTLKCDFH